LNTITKKDQRLKFQSIQWFLRNKNNLLAPHVLVELFLRRQFKRNRTQLIILKVATKSSKEVQCQKNKLWFYKMSKPMLNLHIKHNKEGKFKQTTFSSFQLIVFVNGNKWILKRDNNQKDHYNKFNYSNHKFNNMITSWEEIQ